MRLHALICIWNGSDTIFRCLESLLNVVDDVIILDGKWIGYDGSLLSTDGTQQEIYRFIKTYPNIEVKYFNADKEYHQFEARNLLLSHVPENDWFLWIDVDEIVTACPPDFKYYLFKLQYSKGLRICYAELGRITPQLMDMPRFFRKTKGLRWSKNHRYLNDSDGPVPYSNMPICTDFEIVHIGEHKKMRSAAENYKHWLRIWESENADNLPNFE